MKKYISPEFELIELTVRNVICTPSVTDPVENEGGEHNFNDDWG